jgi:hypothetical protein
MTVQIGVAVWTAFEKYPVGISTRLLPILTEDFDGFPQFLQLNSSILP